MATYISLTTSLDKLFHASMTVTKTYFPISVYNVYIYITEMQAYHERFYTQIYIYIYIYL